MFRIDHYLGKETVQNILALRFANQLFEPIWNSHYVDHVQITMAEDIGLGGRAGYYDGIGAARDVIQNHLLQLLAFIALEEPTSFSARRLRAEKIKVLNATRLVYPLAETTARGQYTGGWQGGELVRGLQGGGGLRPELQDRDLRGDHLRGRRPAAGPACRSTCAPASGWAGGSPRSPSCSSGRRTCRSTPTMTEELGQNAFVIRVQPDEGVTMRFGSKVPGSQMEVRDVTMDFGYGTSFTESSPEAYERLILDVLLGEPSLFPVNEEVERSWEILDPVIEHWAARPRAPTRTRRAAGGRSRRTRCSPAPAGTGAGREPTSGSTIHPEGTLR